ncbi:unnamed protein product [Urochloa humidicola]
MSKKKKKKITGLIRSPISQIHLLPTSGKAKSAGRLASARHPLPRPRWQHARRSALLSRRPVPVNGGRLLHPAFPSPTPDATFSGRRPRPSGRPPLRRPLPMGATPRRRSAPSSLPPPSRAGQAAPPGGSPPPLGPRRRGHLLLPAVPHEPTEHIPMVQPIVSPCWNFMAAKRTARKPGASAC